MVIEGKKPLKHVRQCPKCKEYWPVKGWDKAYCKNCKRVLYRDGHTLPMMGDLGGN